MYPMNYEEAILVSILIPVFNGDFSEIKESLDSIKNQSYTNFECILVDDSSDENITNSLKHYCDDDQRFLHIGRYKKDGLGSALNFGLRQCKGKYIARMDADDVCVIHRIKNQVNYLELNTDISVVGSNMAIIDEQSNIYAIKKYGLNHNSIIRHFSYKNGMGHPSVMFRRNIIDSGELYRKDFRFCEDLELWLRLLKKGYRFSNIDKVLVFYREDRNYNRIKDNWVYNLKARKLHFKATNIYSYISIFSAIINILMPIGIRRTLYKIATCLK